tara:strand:+ start:635 stop:1471 length:837 start_codon:yes stop_codon:yes gene_type:complete
MTGFGEGALIENDSEVYIEIKSVNHRFLEISIKPNDLNNDLDKFIRNSISKKIKRGKVDIRIKSKSSAKTTYSIDSDLLKKLKRSLSKDSTLSEDLRFRDIKDVPGIFKANLVQNTNKKLFKDTFNNALNDFVDSRNEEGLNIENVLIKKTLKIESITANIHKTNNKNLNKRIQSYKLKVSEILNNFDETRIDQEVALLALKHDVSEEIDRILFHTKSLKKEIAKNDSSGKKIDFILQELFREANTLTVKLDDSKMKDFALDIKLFIEEMREQIQNVE